MHGEPLSADAVLQTTSVLPSCTYIDEPNKWLRYYYYDSRFNHHGEDSKLDLHLTVPLAE